MEQAAPSVRRMRFGVYEIDLEAGELRKNGRKISLQEQPFQVLAQLLIHPGKLVTREELQKRIWPADTFVDFDLGLNTTIKKIRAALGDSADNPKFVETLPKRGYRFICPVEEISSEIPPAAKNESLGVSEAHAIPIPIISGANPTAPPAAKKMRYRPWLVAGMPVIILLLLGVSVIRQHLRTRQSAAQPPIQSATDDRYDNYGTRDVAALESYKKGMGFLQAYDMPQNYDKAIQSFEQAIVSDPTYAAAHAELGLAEWKKFKDTGQEQFEGKAEKECNQSIALDAHQPAAYICQGVIHQARGGYERAIRDFSTAIDIDSRGPDADRNRAAAYRGRGGSYQLLGKTKEAEEDFFKAINADRDNWLGYSLLAGLYFQQAHYNEAIEQYRKAMDAAPGNSEPFSNLGAAYVETGQCDKAVLVLQKAIQLRPTFNAYNNLAICSLNARRFQEAATTLEKAIEVRPNNYRVRGNLARAYFGTGQQTLAGENYGRAIGLAMHTLALNPEDQDAALMLAVYHAMLGHKDDANTYLQRVEHLETSAESAFWLSVVHLQLGNRPQALAWLRQARQLQYSLAEINAAPELDNLHKDPEFRQIVASGTNPILNRRTQ